MKNQIKIVIAFTTLFSISTFMLVDTSTGTGNSTNDHKTEKQSSKEIRFETDIIFKEPDNLIIGSITSSAAAPDGRVFLDTGARFLKSMLNLTSCR